MNGNNKQWLITVGLLLFSFLSFGNSTALNAQDQASSELITTEIDIEQATGLDPRADSALRRGRRVEVSLVDDLAVLSPDEQQIKKINQSLKNAIDENKKFIEEKKTIEDELKKLRGDQEIKANRIRALTSQRDGLTERAEKAEQLQKKYGQELNELKSTSANKENLYTGKIKELEKEVAEKKEIEKVIPWSKEIIGEMKDAPASAGGAPEQLDEQNTKLKIDSARLVQDLKKQAQSNLQGMQSNIQKVSNKIAALKAENERLKADSAKLHYNLGNSFFEQRKFDMAAKEYTRVVELMPQDPSAHYNLAYVSSEFLKDYETAKTHYERYLALNPNAEDVYVVKERLLEIGLIFETNIGPPLDKKLKEKPKDGVVR